ncbi:MAG: GIY-YIG nuclease family protein [Gammaproteobacteria bacterium]
MSIGAAPENSEPGGHSTSAADWHVYMVRCAGGSLYTGIARNVSKRVAQHNAGTGAAYTRARRPVVLVHQEPAPDRGSALRREAAIKRLPASAKRILSGG